MTSPSDRVYRIDLFRRGEVLLDEATRRSLLLDLELVDLAAARATDRAPAPRRRRRSSRRSTRCVRSSMAQGLAHPASIMPSDAAASRAGRLDECLARIGAGIRVDGTIGSAFGGDAR